MSASDSESHRSAGEASLNSSSKGLFDVEIVAAMPTQCSRAIVTVRPGSTARQVLLEAVRSQLLTLDHEFGDPALVPLGVYGALVEDDYQVQRLDRLELYRPLEQDPMERRRKRARTSAPK